MERQKDERQMVEKFGTQAFDFLRGHKITPTPRHYEIAYAHMSGANPALSEALTLALKDGAQCDDALLEEIGAQFLHNPESLADTTNDTSAQLQNEMERVSKLIETATNDTSRFGDSMQGVSRNLSANTKPEDLAIVIETIVSASRQMESRSRELEGELQASQEEISELRKRLESARNEAFTDPLTGIANRKAFDEELHKASREAMETGTSFCLLLGDIDHFKRFNDTYGHQTGDQVLKLVAGCMMANVKGRDTAARYGGEEFAVILPKTALRDAQTLANSIREMVQSRELVKRSTGEQLRRITMSIGAAEFRFGEPLNELVERADTCLYAAKDSGRNCVIAETSLPAQKAAAS